MFYVVLIIFDTINFAVISKDLDRKASTSDKMEASSNMVKALSAITIENMVYHLSE